MSSFRTFADPITRRPSVADCNSGELVTSSTTIQLGLRRLKWTFDTVIEVKVTPLCPLLLSSSSECSSESLLESMDKNMSTPTFLSSDYAELLETVATTTLVGSQASS